MSKVRHAPHPYMAIEPDEEGRAGAPQQAFNTWPPTLPMDIALGLSTKEELCEKYDITLATYDAILNIPAFRETLRDTLIAIERDGSRFRAKAQAQAEALLETSWMMIHDPATPRSTAADLIKSTMQWAGRSKPDEQIVNAGSGVSISISFSGTNVSASVQPTETVIEGEVVEEGITLSAPVELAPLVSEVLDVEVVEPVQARHLTISPEEARAFNMTLLMPEDMEYDEAEARRIAEEATRYEPPSGPVLSQHSPRVKGG